MVRVGPNVRCGQQLGRCRLLRHLRLSRLDQPVDDATQRQRSRHDRGNQHAEEAGTPLLATQRQLVDRTLEQPEQPNGAGLSGCQSRPEAPAAVA